MRGPCEDDDDAKAEGRGGSGGGTCCEEGGDGLDMLGVGELLFGVTHRLKYVAIVQMGRGSVVYCALYSRMYSQANVCTSCQAICWSSVF